jgi:NAD(P)-dependent dehydrogenase (short-subunit alcohol dehydrogenase family)
LKLKGKVAIVTGAGQGIGRGIALQLAAEGAKVVVSDITDMAEDLAKEIRQRKQEAFAVKTDVTSVQQAQAMVKAALDRYGRLDILVNNAGIYPQKSLNEMEEKDWDRVMAVNLKGLFNCTKAALPSLQKQGGSIVNISSIAGAVIGFQSLSHYSASKAGVLGFTRAAALELAPHKIRVNAVAPGAIETPTTQQSMTPKLRQQTEQAIPLKRLGQPEDIAKLVLFLVSEDSSYITGQLIIIDGGWTLQ